MKLKIRNKLPCFKNLEVGVPEVIKANSKIHIAMPIRTQNRVGLSIIDHNLNLLCNNLLPILNQIDARSVSIAKTDRIENLEWEQVIRKLKDSFSKSSVKLIICLGIIRYPPLEERDPIMQEAHISVVGGHRGVTKTYKRIKQDYNWENLKEDIQDCIRKCVQCQLKQLVRVKTRVPMIITNSGVHAMDRISMDVVGPLPRSNKGNEYILTFQDLFTKFAIAEPLAQTTAIDVSNVLIKKITCVFGEPRVISID